MKKLLLLFIFIPALAFAAPANQPAAQPAVSDPIFISQIADRPQATWGDAVRFMALVAGGRLLEYAPSLQLLQSRGIVRGSSREASDVLRRGALASMVARHLDLGDSLFYAIFGTGRYAYRACVAAHIMESDGSEWDRISGSELVEIMNKAAERSGGAR